MGMIRLGENKIPLRYVVAAFLEQEGPTRLLSIVEGLIGAGTPFGSDPRGEVVVALLEWRRFFHFRQRNCPKNPVVSLAGLQAKPGGSVEGLR
jgi:hypothetical protein